jgi:hypothetical protein
VEEREAAAVFGLLSWSFVRERVLRGLHFFTWPVKLLQLVVVSAEQQQELLAEFKSDVEIQEVLKGKVKKAEAPRLYQDRHIMELQCVRQWVEAFKATGYQASDAVMQLLERYARALAQTQVVEDINAVQKNATMLRACRRYRKPSTL